MTYRYAFLPYSTGSKVTCPKCHRKNHLTRYVDTTTGEIMPSRYGRCDSTSCGYFNPPPKNEEVEEDRVIVQVEPEGPHNIMSRDLVKKSLHRKGDDNLSKFLHSVYEFPEQNVKKALHNYVVGWSNKFGEGSTVFWQISHTGEVRSGKILHYDPITGKRQKEPFNKISWVHKSFKDYNLKQDFFGKHLVPKFPNSRINIVESEKTAIIATILFGYDPLWLASGQLYGLNLDKFEGLEGRKITLVPDKGEEFYLNWKNKARDIRAEGYDVEVTDFLESETSIEDKDDIADLILLNARRKTTKKRFRETDSGILCNV